MYRVVSRIAVLSAVACVVVMATGWASADTFLRLSFGDLRRLAERVVRAKVVSVRSDWNVDRSFIFTYVSLGVQQDYKGSGPSVLEVRVPGGEVAGRSISAEGMPQFRLGDEVVVFLTRWDDGTVKVLGYFQGLSRIVPSPQGPVLRGGTLDNRLLADVEREIRGGLPPPRP